MPASRKRGILVQMEVVKLGKKGQLNIPRKLLNDLGLEGEAMMIVEKTDEGALLLRPAGVYPIEIYSDERIEQFLEGDRMKPEIAKRVRGKLASKKP
jgi:bifunctional DNA-binding transcriptional regulator/antitoxin component of YhaV-PrlF toxin-antitoxin module